MQVQEHDVMLRKGDPLYASLELPHWIAVKTTVELIEAFFPFLISQLAMLVESPRS
jgi:hypothetical protein